MSPDPHPPEGLAELGASYEECPLQRASVRADRDLRATLRLARRLRQLAPDLLFTYNVKPVVYGTLAGWMAGVSHRASMVTGLGYLFMEGGGRRARVVRRLALPLYRKALSRSHTIIMQNPDDESDLRRIGLIAPEQPVVQVSGSGIDLEQFPVRPLPALPLSFLFVGRLLRDKGLLEFVEAARRLRTEGHDARFVLVGPTDANPSGVTQVQVDGWAEEGVVEVVGPTDDVGRYLAECHVFVLPSYREGTPRSVLEAMSTQRAVITTDAPGCRQTVEHGRNGFLVAVGSADDLARAMRRYIQQPELAEQHGRQSRQRAADVYDVHKVNDVMARALRL